MPSVKRSLPDEDEVSCRSRARWSPSPDAETTRREGAARLIQKWYRRQSSYLRAVVSWQDPVTLEDLRGVPRLLRIVEPTGQEYRFSPESLAEIFFRSANFQHPFTNRHLSYPEVLRTAKLLPSPKMPLFYCTYFLSDLLRNEVSSQLSIETYLEEDSNHHWSEILRMLEKPGCSELDIKGFMWERYKDSMTQLMRASSPRNAVAPLLADHLRQLESRRGRNNQKVVLWLEDKLKESSASWCVPEEPRAQYMLLSWLSTYRNQIDRLVSPDPSFLAKQGYYIDFHKCTLERF